MTVLHLAAVPAGPQVPVPAVSAPHALPAVRHLLTGKTSATAKARRLASGLRAKGAACDPSAASNKRFRAGSVSPRMSVKDNLTARTSRGGRESPLVLLSTGMPAADTRAEAVGQRAPSVH